MADKLTLEQIIEFLEREVKHCSRWHAQKPELREFYKGKIAGLEMAIANLKDMVG